MSINKVIQFNVIKMTESLNWIYKNEPESIFCEPVFAMLKKWYEKYGLKSFVVANMEMIDFELGDVYLKEIKKEISWLKIITDTNEIEGISDTIIFDKCIDQVFVDQALESTQKNIYKSRGRKRSFVLCNGQDILRINIFLEMYFDKLSQINKPLYLNVSVIIEDKMYFTVCNDENLYILDLQTQEISLFMCLGSRVYKSKFVGMFAYNRKLWLIPCFESKIFVCDLSNKTLYKLPIPMVKKQGRDEDKFRKSIQVDDRYLWLLPRKDKALICIDMETLTYKIHDNWPEQVSFDDEATMNFRSMCYSEGKLFLFKTGCSHNIVVDIKSGKMIIWDFIYSDVFASIYKEHFYLSPHNKEKKIQIMKYDFNTHGVGKTIESYDISSEVKDVTIYSYWYVEILNNNVYFLPFEAKSIIIYNVAERNFRKIEPVIEDYNNLRETKGFSVYLIDEFEDNTYIVPYAGNKLIWIDSRNQIHELELVYPIMKINEILNVQIEKKNLLKFYCKYVPKRVFVNWEHVLGEERNIDCGKRIYNVDK